METIIQQQPIPDRLTPELINEALSSNDQELFVTAVSYFAKSNLTAEPLLKFEDSCLAKIQDQEMNAEKIVLFFKDMFNNLGDCSIEGIKRFISLSRKGLSDFKHLPLYLNLIPLCSENDFPQAITQECLATLNENCKPEFCGAIIPLLLHFQENTELFDLAVNLLQKNPQGFVFSEISISKLNQILKHDFKKGIILYETYLNSCPANIYEKNTYCWTDQIGALKTSWMTENQKAQIWNINYRKLVKQFSDIASDNGAKKAVEAILKFDKEYHLRLFRKFVIQTCYRDCCKVFIPYYFQSIDPLICNLAEEFSTIREILEGDNKDIIMTHLHTYIIAPILESKKEKRIRFCYDWLLFNKDLFGNCSPTCISQYCIILPMDIVLQLFSNLYQNIGRKPAFSFLAIFIHSFIGWDKQDANTAEAKIKQLMTLIPKDASDFKNQIEQKFESHFAKKREDPQYDISLAIAQNFLNAAGITTIPPQKIIKTEQPTMSQQRKEKIIQLLTQS